jgi:endonuclease YncB( thermonuclease family)
MLESSGAGTPGKPAPSVARNAPGCRTPGRRVPRGAGLRFTPSLLLLVCLSAGAAAQTTAVVRAVTDGDSFEVVLDGVRERVRLIGVDTPESSPNRKAYRDAASTSKQMDVIIAAGRRATSFVKTLLAAGDTVTLELDVQERDQYGRILAYLFLSDGRMLNEVLLREGYARLYTRPPNVKYVTRLREAAVP